MASLNDSPVTLLNVIITDIACRTPSVLASVFIAIERAKLSNSEDEKPTAAPVALN